MADLGSGDVLLMHSACPARSGCSRATATARPANSTTAQRGSHARSRGVPHVVGCAILFNDPRRFGYMKIIARNAWRTNRC